MQRFYSNGCLWILSCSLRKMCVWFDFVHFRTCSQRPSAKAAQLVQHNAPVRFVWFEVENFSNKWRHCWHAAINVARKTTINKFDSINHNLLPLFPNDLSRGKCQQIASNHED